MIRVGGGGEAYIFQELQRRRDFITKYLYKIHFTF